MKIKLTEQNFQNLVSYWAGQLRLPLPFFRRDNRMLDSANIHSCSCSCFTFTYNFKTIKTLTDDLIIGLLFHELGHIKYKHEGETIKSESEAERFSLRCMKKYYPDYLNSVIENTKEQMKDKIWKKNYPIHAKAYAKIKEYKDVKNK